jgi:hypothetical protein
MTRTGLLFAWAVLGSAVAAGSAAVGAEMYQYRVEHPLYGEIGTYTNLVDRTGDGAVVETRLHVAVKVLGITMYTEDAERTEQWQHGRLVSFRGVTDINGEKLEVSGTAEGSKFLVFTATGTVEAPANVRPTNPWSAKLLGEGALMSTRTGEVHPAYVNGVVEETVSLSGTAKKLTRYEVDSDDREFVWFDEAGVPVAFRTETQGAPIDFVLASYPQGKLDLWAGLPKENGAVMEPVSLRLGLSGTRATGAR